MSTYNTEDFYNPSAAYLAARRVRADVETARHSIAQIIGSRPAEVIFTAGATESINLAFTARGAGYALTDAAEHDSVLATAKAGHAEIIPVDKSGRVSLSEIEQKLISDSITLVSIGYVNSETGASQDIKGIAALVKEARARRAKQSKAKGQPQMPLYFHIDASQAAGLYDLNVARLGVDLMTLNAEKCYGPKQVGLLYTRAGVKLRPIIYGGGQELGLRSGTENVPGIIGFAQALSIADRTRQSEFKRLSTLRSRLKQILAAGLPDIKFNECPRDNSPAILSFSVPNVDGERVVFALDEQGIMVATGSACAANKGQRSHVLTAMHLSTSLADGSLRVSLGRFTTASEIETAGTTIVQTINEQRQFGGLKIA